MIRQNPSMSDDRPSNTAASIRQAIEAGSERYWTLKDFPGEPPAAVLQCLSRLTKAGMLQRVGRGLYYRSRPTVFGESRPSKDEVLALRITRPLVPAGFTAANVLGFSTQNPAQRQFATTAKSVAFANDTLRVTTRRPESWSQLPAEDAALLDVIRSRGRHSELSEKATIKRLLKLLGDPGRFERLVDAAATEPPRVRAILGAAGQELGVADEMIKKLRAMLKNGRSRFDFGLLRVLKHSGEWQAK